jgi:hypothetical protein
VIRNNKFNDLYVQQVCPEDRKAILLTGNNDNLNIICNEFEKFSTDIYLDPSGRLNDVPDANQPNMLDISSTPSQPLGSFNKLSFHTSSAPLCDINIVNNGSSMLNYWYFTGQTSVNKIPNRSGSPLDKITTNGNAKQVECALTCADLDIGKPLLNTKKLENSRYKFRLETHSDKFVISTGNGIALKSINIFDLSGRLINSYTFGESDIFDMNYSDYRSGLYIIEVENVSGEVGNEKILMP